MKVQIMKYDTAGHLASSCLNRDPRLSIREVFWILLSDTNVENAEKCKKAKGKLIHVTYSLGAFHSSYLREKVFFREKILIIV